MATADHDPPEDEASLLNLNNDILNEILGYLSLQVCMYVVIFAEGGLFKKSSF